MTTLVTYDLHILLIQITYVITRFRLRGGTSIVAPAVDTYQEYRWMIALLRERHRILFPHLAPF